jgi:hypothetical protein
MRGERWLLRTGEFLVGRAARHLPAAARAERYQEWAAELPVILRDPQIKPAAARAARMLWFAADTLRGAALGRGPARRGGAHRGSASIGKDVRWLGVGLGLLAALAVSLGILAFIAYYAIVICSASLAGYVSFVLSFSLASLAGCLLWRRREGAARCWLGAGVLATVAGGGVAQLAGHLGWGHPLLFTLISTCGYTVCAACVSAAVVTVTRSARRDRQAGTQERSDRGQLPGPARAVRMSGQLRVRQKGPCQLCRQPSRPPVDWTAVAVATRSTKRTVPAAHPEGGLVLVRGLIRLWQGRQPMNAVIRIETSNPGSSTPSLAT